MPIVGWETDMLWGGTGWAKFKPNEDWSSDNNTYLLNRYRVLLTRGRDGFVVFIPQDRRLDSVYEILILAGLREL